MWLYPLYASRPPPPGPLEDQDQSDDEDLYDWYTWPRALAVLDGRSVATLRVLACSLAAAAAAGALPSKWGGVFGQEWLESLDAPPPAAPEAKAATAVPPPPSAAALTALGGGAGKPLSALMGALPLAELLELAAAASTAAAARVRSGDAVEEAPPPEEAEEEEVPKFRALKPFPPERLDETLQQLATDRDGARLEGIAWLATQPDLQALVKPRHDGTGGASVEPGDPWWAVIPRAKWPEGLEADIKPLWHEPMGDRQTELALLPLAADGPPLPTAACAELCARLEACLVTEAEAGLPPAELDDPFAELWKPVLLAAAKEENAAKIEDDVRSAFERARAPKGRFVSMSFGAAASGKGPQCVPCLPCGPTPEIASR